MLLVAVLAENGLYRKQIILPAAICHCGVQATTQYQRWQRSQKGRSLRSDFIGGIKKISFIQIENKDCIYIQIVRIIVLILKDCIHTNSNNDCMHTNTKNPCIRDICPLLTILELSVRQPRQLLLHYKSNLGILPFILRLIHNRQKSFYCEASSTTKKQGRVPISCQNFIVHYT